MIASQEKTPSMNKKKKNSGGPEVMCFSMSVWTDALKRVLLCEKTGK